MIETRHFELRQSGERSVSGICMRYGSRASLPFGEEMFSAGAFGDLSQADIILNRQHIREMPLARTKDSADDDYGRLILNDDERRLLVTADLPDTTEARDTMELVKAKILRGLSIEFEALEDRYEGSLRIIDRAIISGVGIVDRPAYADAQLRQLEKRFASAGVVIPRRRRKRVWL